MHIPEDWKKLLAEVRKQKRRKVKHKDVAEDSIVLPSDAIDDIHHKGIHKQVIERIRCRDVISVSLVRKKIEQPSQITKRIRCRDEISASLIRKKIERPRRKHRKRLRRTRIKEKISCHDFVDAFTASLPTITERLEYRDGQLYWKPRPDATPSGRMFNTHFAGKQATRKKKEGRTGEYYLLVESHGKRYCANRLVWEMHHGPIEPKFLIKHHNNDRLDIRIENLYISRDPRNSR